MSPSSCVASFQASSVCFSLHLCLMTSIDPRTPIHPAPSSTQTASLSAVGVSEGGYCQVVFEKHAAFFFFFFFFISTQRQDWWGVFSYVSPISFKMGSTLLKGPRCFKSSAPLFFCLSLKSLSHCQPGCGMFSSARKHNGESWSPDMFNTEWV